MSDADPCSTAVDRPAPKNGHPGLIGRRSKGEQWIILLAISAVFVVILEFLQLPAALMIGPMCAGILVATADGAVRVPQPLYYAAQSMIGCMIARSIKPEIIGEILHEWPLFAGAVVSVVGASMVLGWLLTRRRVLPGTTAIWGSFPGAAAAMTLMAEAHGEDFRLVAMMQYLRVVIVAAIASLVARIWVAGTGGPLPEVVWFPAVAWTPFAETLALAATGVIVARLLRIPAGPLLVPLVASAVLQGSGLLIIEQPPWLLAVSYALLGWTIGLRFTRAILAHAARALPRLVASILALVAVCGAFAVVLTVVVGVDPLTAYLAMSPGGADTVAIIAASSNVDAPFVMALQMARFITVLFFGPALARLVAGRMGATAKRSGAGLPPG